MRNEKLIESGEMKWFWAIKRRIKEGRNERRVKRSRVGRVEERRVKLILNKQKGVDWIRSLWIGKFWDPKRRNKYPKINNKVKFYTKKIEIIYQEKKVGAKKVTWKRPLSSYKRRSPEKASKEG